MEEPAWCRAITQHVDREIEIIFLHFSARRSHQSCLHLPQRPREPSMCSEETSRPPQGISVNRCQEVFVADVRAGIVRILVAFIVIS